MVTHGVVKYDRLVARLDPTSSGRAITWSPPNASPLTGQWRSDEAFTSPFGHQVRRERLTRRSLRSSDAISSKLSVRKSECALTLTLTSGHSTRHSHTAGFSVRETLFAMHHRLFQWRSEHEEKEGGRVLVVCYTSSCFAGVIIAWFIFIVLHFIAVISVKHNYSVC